MLQKKLDIENSNPNIPAVNLPYVNYDTASSIKVVSEFNMLLSIVVEEIQNSFQKRIGVCSE